MNAKICDKDVKLVKLYTSYMGYKLKYDPDFDTSYVVDGSNKICLVNKDKKGLYVHRKDVMDRIDPILIIKGLINRHRHNFIPFISKLLS